MDRQHVPAAILACLALIFEVQVHVFRRTGPVVLWLHATVLPLSLMSFVVSLGISVFYRGAVDPSLVVKKATVLGAVGLFLTTLFIVGEELLSAMVVHWLGLPDFFGGVLAGLLAAAFLGPLYRWINGITRGSTEQTAS